MDLKKKLKRGEVTIGSWITIADPAIAEIMARIGFDWLTIDMEHSAIDIATAQNLVRIIELCGVSPLVRVGENNPNIIKRVMDTGAHGVIVPMVNTREDAENAVNSVKYPPLGKRGVGLARAQGYGMEFKRYNEWVNKESIVIVQIEHIDAVNNLNEILSVKGLDGFIVGPYDLSASLGKPGKFEDPNVRKALEKVKKVSKEHDVVSGFHVIPPDAGKLLQKIREGYNFLGFSLDSLFLALKCKDELKRIKLSKEKK